MITGTPDYPDLRTINYPELLERHAAKIGDKTVYYEINERGEEVVQITYSELVRNVKLHAKKLREVLEEGDRCMIICQPGLEFIIGFLACLFAGVIAVPVNPPKRNKANKRFWDILRSSTPRALLMDNCNLKLFENHFSDFSILKDIERIGMNHKPEAKGGFIKTDIQGDDIAFLQYTSGSTGRPKGVMVSHKSFIHNSEVIKQAFSHTQDLIMVTWLPPFHDMGLIGNLFQPLYVGGSSVIMSPGTFLRKPLIWLEAISKYMGTTTGCPNFALDYAVEKISEEERQKLDLSSLDVLYCGSETIRKKSLDSFYGAFSESGFRYRSFLPCYGLAESTLYVSGSGAIGLPESINISKSQLETKQIATSPLNESDSLEVVSCGKAWIDTYIAIVDPDTKQELPDGTVGEVWASSDSVCQGYYEDEEATREGFMGIIEDQPGKQWLRTGDLGFIVGDQLYVTGRIKDIIIIRGVNFFPDFIEDTVENCHPALQKSGCAAFSIEHENAERLVIVQEIKRTALRDLPAEEIYASIREAVSREFEINVFAIILISPNSIPKTSSGKVQRHLCKKDLLIDKLKITDRWQEETMDSLFEKPGEVEGDLSLETLEDWLAAWVAKKTKTDPSEINKKQSILSFGLDSIAMVELERDVKNNFDIEISISDFLENNTIEELARIGMNSASVSA